MVFTVLIGVPLLLSILPTPKNTTIRETALRHIGATCSRTVTKPGSSRMILTGAGLAMVIGLLAASNVQIGDSEPGSPILYPEHDYNVSSRVVNESFPARRSFTSSPRPARTAGSSDRKCSPHWPICKTIC